RGWRAAGTIACPPCPRREHSRAATPAWIASSRGCEPPGFKYRPTTPQDAPDSAKARKQAQQARDAREGARASAPSDSGMAVGPPRILLAASDAEGATPSPTGEDALAPYLEFIHYNEERLKRSDISQEEK